MMFNGNKAYSPREVMRFIGISLLTFLLWRITKGYGAIITGMLVLVATTHNKPVSLIYWVLFMTLSACGNRQIFTVNIASVLIVRMTLLILSVVMVGKLLGKKQSPVLSPFCGIFVYIAWEAMISIQGFSVVISYLKLILFCSVIFAMLGIANVVIQSSRTQLRSLRAAILALLSIMIFGSVLVIPFPSISIMASKEALQQIMTGDILSLFQGMTCQSQVLGSMMGILATFILADMVFSLKRWDRLYVALFLCCPFLIYKSASRTGMGTFVAGCMMVGFLAMRSRLMGAQWKSKVIGLFSLVGLCGLILVLIIPNIRERIFSFVVKRVSADSAEVTSVNILSSRQSRIDNELQNFKRKPMLGNGFQVSDDMIGAARKSIVEYMSAPVEKGMWIFAVLEEGGAVGFVLFVGWLLVLFWMLIRRNAYVGASVFMAYIVSNLGEFSIFATTYIGGFYWTLSFAAICIDAQQEKCRKMSNQCPLQMEMSPPVESIDVWRDMQDLDCRNR